MPQHYQFRKISDAAKAVLADDHVVIHSGIYREAITIERSGKQKRPIVFEAAPGAEVTVTGLDPLSGWRKEDSGLYSIAWAHRFIPWSKTDAYPDDEFHRLIGRAEQVLINDQPLQQVLDRSSLQPGTFFVDLAGRRLYVAPFPGQQLDSRDSPVRVEASTRPMLLDCKASNVVIRGIHFRYCANHALDGAATFRGRNNVVENCSFENTNAVGAHFTGRGQSARNCTFARNGQFGFTTHRARNLRVIDCAVRDNNTKGFSHQWAAGGCKIVLSRDVVIDHCRFIDNHGPGIWFDIGNENGTVRNCLIAGNEDAGILYEISYGLRAHDNVITGNGFANTPGAWGMQAAIVLSSSPDCVVTRNLLVGNREGFNFREQPRTTPRIDQPNQPEVSVWNRNEIVRNNLIAFNRDAQTRGWFGVADRRLWPRKIQEEEDRVDRNDPANASVRYLPVQKIALEDLKLDMAGNVYAIQPGQPLFIWGASWLPHRDYGKIAEVEATLGLERGSQQVEVAFRDVGAKDFRVREAQWPELSKCYPHEGVPDARLGVSD